MIKLSPEGWVLVIAWTLIIVGLAMLLHWPGAMIGVGILMLFTFGGFEVTVKRSKDA